MLNPIQFDLYDETINQMHKFVESTNLPFHKNPIINNLNKMSIEKLESIIKEHSCFCNNAFKMLIEVKNRTTSWPLLNYEIKENIKEELGSKTNNIPHLKMMRKGYKKDLNIEVKNYKPELNTKIFLNNLWKIFENNSEAYLAGALLAFEGMALTEFKVLDKVINKYSNKLGKKLEKGYTKDYIEGHKEFEIDHEFRLRNSIKSYINESNVRDFIRGYKKVILEMENWWNNL